MMNDRYRYRVFSKSTGCYIADCTLNMMTGRVKNFDKDDIVVEQCTGLKDKTGNLIYENDIIEIIGNGGKKLHFRVAFSDRNGGYYFPEAPLYYSFDFLDSHLYEVVGNIHENPELLEDK